MSLLRSCDFCHQPSIADNHVRHMYLRHDTWTDGVRRSTTMGGIDLCDKCRSKITDKNVKKRESGH